MNEMGIVTEVATEVGTEAVEKAACKVGVATLLKIGGCAGGLALAGYGIYKGVLFLKDKKANKTEPENNNIVDGKFSEVEEDDDEE